MATTKTTAKKKPKAKESQRQWGEVYKDSQGLTQKYYPLHAGQARIHNSDARYLLMLAGTGGGKTCYEPLWLFREIGRKPNGVFIVAAPTHKILQQALLPKFTDAIFGTSLDGGREAMKAGAGEYHLPTGGKIYFRSMERPEIVEGIHADAIVCDEAGQITLKAWHILQRRVGQTGGRILLGTTPYEKYDWLRTQFITRYEDGDPDYFVSRFKSTENPTYSIAEYERARKEMPKWKFDMYYNGLFTVPEGAVYPDLRECIVDVPTTGIPEGYWYGGIDFGGSDATAVLVGCLDNEDVLWLFWEFYKPGCDLLDLAKRLRTWHNSVYERSGRQVERWFCDSNPSAIGTLKKYKINAYDNGPSLCLRNTKKGVVSAGSIQYGIDLVTARIRTGKLKIVRGAITALLKEGDSYRYKATDEGVSLDSFVGADHALDCLRYLVTGIDRKRNLMG